MTLSANILLNINTFLPNIYKLFYFIIYILEKCFINTSIL